MTHHWSFHDAPSPPELAAIAALLRNGAVVLLPTDTIYGLHALATDESAVARVAAMKGRDAAKPFLVLGGSREQLEEVGIAVTPEVRALLDSLWPAPLTAILPLGRPVAAARGADSLAVRVPALDWLRSLVSMSGPLVSTSANRSGEPPITRPEMLDEELSGALDAIVDGGLREGEASVIVDFTSAEPRLIREGDRLFTQKVWKTLRKSL